MMPHTYRTEHSETRTTNGDYGDYYRVAAAKKIKIQPPLLKLLRFMDSNKDEMAENLRQVIAIKSISSELKYRNEIMKLVKIVEDWMIQLGIVYECFNIGFHEMEGKKIRLPPIILAHAKSKPGRKTVCVYANIDVSKPVSKNWATDPWTLTEKDKAFYGNGVVQGKGALWMWLHAIMAFRQEGIPLPINVKFVIECMHFHRSEGMKEFLLCQRQNFLSNVDYIVVNGSEWLGDKYPCLTYGCVGMLHFTLTMTKNAKARKDMKDEMDSIAAKIAKQDQILIPDFNKYVSQVTPDEEQLLEGIVFDMEEARKSLPPEKKHWSKSRFLSHFWRYPSIFVGDIEECICEKKDTAKIKRRFITKLVPKQNAEDCISKAQAYIKVLQKELNLENKVELDASFDTRPWLENFASTNYEAARRATIQIYKEDPSMIREDKDMKCINILQVIEKSILLLPLGIKGGNGGEENEHIPLRNFYEGTKLIAAYLFQVQLLTTQAP